VNVRAAAIGDAPAMAGLHIAEIDEGFLPTLGPAFLTRLYRRIVRSPSAFAFVAESDGEVVGFSAGAEHLGALYRAFLLRDGLAAAAVAAPRLARSWRRVAETLRYPARDAGDLPTAELIAIAVRPAARGHGVGRALVEAITTEFARRGITAARVVAGAQNEAALGLYRACGFRHAATAEVHRGTASQVLTWS
jgi:ribosomal protein S18 acetylase RimI-like enzyme